MAYKTRSNRLFGEELQIQRRMFRDDPQLQEYFLEGVSPTGKKLGCGSYGSVIEVKYHDTVCAAKEIHEILLDPDNHGVADIIKKYQRECQLMASVSHSNLTKFLGLCFVQEAYVPLLVMERLEMSLDELLHGALNISLLLKLSILHGTCCGLVYLHGRQPPIIHRDLTARNVLISSSMSAKIADFGCSRMIDMQPGQRAQTLSKLPGTLLYMPPEALDDSHRYGPSLDVFSFGHLTLYTVIQESPQNLLSYTYPDPKNREHIIARSEVERRQPYMNILESQVAQSQPMILELVKQCLHNAPEKRPSSEDLLTKLHLMKVKAEGNSDGSLKHQNVDKDEKIQEMLIVQKNLTSQVHSLQAEVQTLKEELERLTLNSTEIKVLHKKKSSRIKKVKEQSKLNYPLNLDWTRCPDMPLSMSGNIQAVEIEGTLFVGGGTAEKEEDNDVVMAFDKKSSTWYSLPSYYINRFAMATINKKLVLVGGWYDNSNVGRLGVYHTEQNKWANPFAPMTTARQLSSAASYKHWLVVAGGFDGYKALSTVEILDIDNNQWFTTPSMTKPWYHMKSTIMNDTWYLMGGCDKTTISDVYSASLEALVSHTKSDNSIIWKQETSLGYFASSPLSLGGSLLAIGGWNKENQETVSTIQCYVPDTNAWIHAGSIPLTLHNCTCIQTANKLYVMGGHDGVNKSASTYFCII